MSYRFQAALLVVLTFLAIPLSSQALDKITVATITEEGRKLIRIYDGAGELIGDIPIADQFEEAEFLTGNWDPNDPISILALTSKRKKATAHIINSEGTVISSFDLGKNVFRVLALNNNGNELTDLLVQSKRKGSLTFYDDPGIAAAPTSSGRTPKRTDSIHIYSSGIDSVGFLKISGKSGKKKRKKRKGKNYVQYFENGRKRRVALPRSDYQVLPIEVNDAPAFVLIKNKQFEVLGAGLERYEERKSGRERLFIGHFRSSATTDIALGSPDGTVVYVDPSTRERTTVTIDINATTDAPDPEPEENPNPEPDPEPGETACEKLNRLMADFFAAISSGNFALAQSIHTRIIEEGLQERCAEERDPSGGGGGFNGGDDEQTNFRNDGITYLTNVVQYASNTGTFMGPCEQFIDPFDGDGGFLAKVTSYTSNGRHYSTVYLTEYDYVNGRVLHPKRLNKVLHQALDSGIANGFRKHFRVVPDLFSIGEHVFAADQQGETHCWRIPGGTGRVD